MDRRRFLRNSVGLGAAVALQSAVPARVWAALLPGDIVDFTAIDLSNAIRTRRVGCVETMQAYLQHIHRHNPAYNAIVGMVDDDVLLAQARDADAALARGEYRGWMHGMPHAVKDLAPVAGLRFTDGSPMFANRIAEADSDLVARIRGDGAIFIGKTNSPEFGLGSQTYNPVFGATGSAWNPALTSGGSSGGAASGLGTHMLPVADGSDMMGSLRNPGAFNNVIGFRPSTNVMSGRDDDPRPLSTSGPMGRNTRDTIRFLQTIAAAPVRGPVDPLALRGSRIAWLGDLDGYLATEPGILGLCESALGTLRVAGAEIDPTAPVFDPADLLQCWTTLRHSGRRNMQRYLDDPATRGALKPELVWEIEQGLTLGETAVEHANGIRRRWVAEVERLFSEYDFLVLPTAQVFPFPKDVHWPTQIAGREMDTYHRWMEVVILASLAGVPTINVPVGFDGQGRPMGMQVMAKFGADRHVLEFALAYEDLTDHLDQRPRLATTASA